MNRVTSCSSGLWTRIKANCNTDHGRYNIPILVGQSAALCALPELGIDKDGFELLAVAFTRPLRLLAQHLRSDVNLAWPSAEVAVMGAKGAVGIIFRGKDPERVAKEVEDYEAKFYTPVRLRPLPVLCVVIADAGALLMRHPSPKVHQNPHHC